MRAAGAVRGRAPGGRYPSHGRAAAGAGAAHGGSVAGPGGPGRWRDVRPRISVAPMMALTDRHFRRLARLLSRQVLLYTEMVTARAVLHGDRERLLGRSPEEGAVVLQLGGSDPGELREAAAAGAAFGYAEVNLNVGCPSDRVRSGRFGACLMAEPELVGECLAALAESGLPVSVKHRIGVDDADAYDDLLRFVDVVEASSGGVPVAYTVHARKAWLHGLSPRENRTVPPLRYEDVYRLKRERPGLTVELNGGVPDVAAAAAHLRHVDGVMIGRAFYDRPVLLADVDPVLAGASRPLTRRQVVEAMADHAAAEMAAGTPLPAVARHLLNLFKGVPGGRSWRRALTEGAHRPGAGPELLLAALRAVPAEVLDAPLGAAPDGRRAAA